MENQKAISYQNLKYKTKYKQIVKDEYASENYRKTPTKNQLLHFEWIVRYQIQELSHKDIVVHYNKELQGDYNLNENTITKAIERTAKIFDFKLRKHPPGDRPRKNSGHLKKFINVFSF